MFEIIIGVIAVAVIAFAGAWLILSIKIVGPAEMAVKVIFGKPVEFCDSGWVFDLRLPLGKRFKCFLQRYPKKMYNFDYKAREVITMAGEYPPNDEGVQYGALKVKVDAVAYLNFPREKAKDPKTGEPAKNPETGKPLDENPEEPFDEHHPLIKILKAGVPVEDEKLKDWTEEAVVGALRLAFSQMTWPQAVEDMKEINKKINEVFLDADGALIKAGFRSPGIRLVVAEIHLPKSVEDALNLPEKARLEADAAQKIAEAQAIDRVETILHMMAKTRGVKLENIKKEIENSPKLQREFLQYAKKLHAQLEKAEKGAFFEFNAPGKSGLDKSILSFFALWKGMPSGIQQTKTQKPKEEKEGKEEKTKPIKKPIRDDLDKAMTEIEEEEEEGE